MTHPTYTQQALSRYTLPRLKRIAAERGVTPTSDVKLGEVGFSRGTWWVVGAVEQKRVACQSALVAVR